MHKSNIVLFRKIRQLSKRLQVFENSIIQKTKQVLDLSEESTAYLNVLKLIAQKKCPLPPQNENAQIFVKNLLTLFFESLSKCSTSINRTFQEEEVPQQVKLALNHCNKSVYNDLDCPFNELNINNVLCEDTIPNSPKLTDVEPSFKSLNIEDELNPPVDSICCLESTRISAQPKSIDFMPNVSIIEVSDKSNENPKNIDEISKKQPKNLKKTKSESRKSTNKKDAPKSRTKLNESSQNVSHNYSLRSAKKAEYIDFSDQNISHNYSLRSMTRTRFEGFLENQNSSPNVSYVSSRSLSRRAQLHGSLTLQSSTDDSQETTVILKK